MGMVPGAGGLMGGGEAATGLAALDSAKNQPYGTNGWATRSNFFRVPEGLIWYPKGNADAQLNIIFRAERAAMINSGGSPENLPLGTNLAATANVTRGWNYPTVMVAECMVFLVGSVIGPRTRAS